MSKQAEQLLAYIVDYKRAHDGVAPSIREMAREMNYGTSTVFYHLGRLREAGLIDVVEEGASRAIMVVGGYGNV